ncbi:MAG: RHS repeat domain-containing protein [Acidobacteriota bacterium]
MAAQAKLLHLCLAAFCLPAFANVPRGLLLTEKLHQGGESFVLPSHRGSTAFTEGAVSETNNYDSFGNRWVTTVRGLVADPLTPAGPGWFSAASNQMTGVPYDAAGNQIQFNPYTMSYDAEGRVVSATSAANGSAVYAYDGEGRRVKKIVNGNATTVYVYDGLGRLAAEYGAGSGGSGLEFLTEDHLGSVRLVTGPLGNVIRRHDYRPFGQDLSGVNGRGPRYGDSRNVKRYTGKERDGETGLDYFGARYMSAAQGRFTGPDAPFMDQHENDPQSWNLYSYVRNNPLIFTDPTGNDCVYLNSAGNGIDSINNQNTSKDCGKTGGYWVDGTVTDARFAHGSLILTGTTDGKDRTSSSYGLGPDPGLMTLKEAGTRASRDLSTSAIIMGGTAVAIAGAQLYPVAAGGIAAYRVAQATAALQAAQEAWKRIPIQQRQAVMDWLSKIKPGAPPPGPLPPGANIEALKPTCPSFL